MKPDKRQKIQGWIEVAEKDIQTATLLLEQELWAYDVLCFHCQQAAEKFFKALLVYHDTEPPKVHDIRQLLAMLLRLEEKVIALEDAVDLNDYAVRYRYPDHLAIDDKAVAERALRLATEVKKFVLEKIK